MKKRKEKMKNDCEKKEEKKWMKGRIKEKGDGWMINEEEW